MEFISVFDMFKIGVGPSSSHTLGPWQAARKFVQRLKDFNGSQLNGGSFEVSLYGSLSLTGKGHATDLAIMMGLSGFDPVTIDTHKIPEYIDILKSRNFIQIDDGVRIHFNPDKDIVFEKTFLPYHANGMMFKWFSSEGNVITEVYYSIGGGFIIREGEDLMHKQNDFSHPFQVTSSDELLKICQEENISISELVLQNEIVSSTREKVEDRVITIWDTMLESMYIGCHTEGLLPGKLGVVRRGGVLNKKLLTEVSVYRDKHEWLETIRKSPIDFQKIFKWVSTFGISVNEVNAAFGRVVTAPTNGSAGVIPAVLMYYLSFVNKFAGHQEIVRFLFCASEIGSLFKKGSTISAAMGGCQAEIGVSSAMAAAGLTELLGGTPAQCIIAAEIAMEHHLGMTCDPIGGLVQVPCIERNSMGAIKAINAAEMAIDRDPKEVKVPFDKVVATMWATAQDMHSKYKETSEGGLATTVNIIDC